MTAVVGLLAAWAAAGLWAFALFGFDKARARAGGRRTPERTLLWAALLGGPGAWLGQQVFRHKTRKQPFAGWLAAAVAVNLLSVVGLVWMMAG